MAITLEETLSGFGNSNYIGCFLEEFEKSINLNNEEGMPLFIAPNYYAWICAASEHVFYSIRETIYLNTGEHESFNFSYAKLINYIIENHALGKEKLEAIILFAKIRHLVVHKGFPNPHSSPSTDEREIAKGYPFTKKEVEELAVMLRNTCSFASLHASHRTAIDAIFSCQKEFNHDFGFMKIST